MERGVQEEFTKERSSRQMASGLVISLTATVTDDRGVGMKLLFRRTLRGDGINGSEHGPARYSPVPSAEQHQTPHRSHSNSSKVNLETL